jgi:hypothetical protein
MSSQIISNLQHSEEDKFGHKFPEKSENCVEKEDDTRRISDGRKSVICSIL